MSLRNPRSVSRAVARLESRARHFKRVRVVSRSGEEVEGNLFPFFDQPVAGLTVAELADVSFFEATDIQSVHVWERSWFGLGPCRWRLWFERRDA